MKQNMLAIILLGGCAVLGLVSCFIYLEQDRVAPTITIGKAEITYHEDENYQVLLSGVTAEDNRDGELTDEIFIDKIVPIKNGKATVHYGVMDKSRNVGIGFRTVTYVTKEQGTTPQDADAGTERKEQVQEQIGKEVSAANTEPIPIPEGEAPVIALNADRTTIAVGSEFNPLSVVKGMADTVDDVDTLSKQISVEGDYNLDAPGEYHLRYYVTDSDGNTSEVKDFILMVQ